ncbi:gamma-glutamylcyclotransferase (GGCT)/AIG2-like uncharacterized protein YtfP [Rheinheimera pacifica]|uniref:gamma-glutamylcyclotransferase family protein n=1 Tax=Rheinheimera pacifica TaxID=173990 RepID=UPI002167BB62|nr:gamma-glutamylcyclotransferase family protein [Rheinheimera pacifica]MCS4306900.1 gamma-glutamylcyclotransferase (GGCT)/AIG2-like uncharacterized protein YtfP [Rheinheimera pacifica]
MQHYLFVYGTLRQNANHPMHQLLAQHSRFIGKARYQAQLYRIDYYPGAVPSNNVADQVVGELYQLIQPDLLLPELDNYEECSSRFTPPHEYRREQQNITLDNGYSVVAWVYVYNRNTDGLALIHSGDFLADQIAQ